MSWSNEIFERNWIELHLKVQEKKIIEAFGLMRDAGIEPILIKGWAIARHYPNYPKGHQRPFADIDLCVAPKFYKEASKLLESEQAKRLNIDLHDGLRHFDTLEWDELFETHGSLILKRQRFGFCETKTICAFYAFTG